MTLIRNALLRAANSRWLAEQVRRRAFVRRAAARFLPGEDLDSAVRAAEQLAARGIASVLTELGENVENLDDVRAVTRHYLEVLDTVARRGLPSQISVKLTHLGLDLSVEACVEQTEILARRAAETGNFVWLDMEGSAYTGATLDLFRQLRAAHPNVGVCVQTYLYRTAQDLERLAPLQPAIRLVKGAYQEPPSIAFPRKKQVDANYLALADRLLRDGAFLNKPGPAFGTHDMNIIAALQRRAAEFNVPKNAFEIQMLYGIRRADQLALVAAGYTVRVLISYGDAWFPWYMRRLAERPANLWFVVRSLVSG